MRVHPVRREVYPHSAYKLHSCQCCVIPPQCASFKTRYMKAYLCEYTPYFESSTRTELKSLIANVDPKEVTACPGFDARAAMNAEMLSVVPPTISQDSGSPYLNTYSPSQRVTACPSFDKHHTLSAETRSLTLSATLQDYRSPHPKIHSQHPFADEERLDSASVDSP